VGEGLVVGVGVDVEVGLGDVLVEVPVDPLVDVLGEGEVLADVEALVDSLADLLPAVDLLGVGLVVPDTRPCADNVRSVSDAVSTEFLGTDAQAVLAVDWATVFVARASPDMLAVKKANPVRAPITTGFASCALTREPHFSAASG
jgi:hypothetical protein